MSRADSALAVYLGEASRLIEHLRSKAPRACRLRDEVRDAIDATAPGPRQDRLQMLLLGLAAKADSGSEASDADEHFVREVLDGE